MNEREFKKHLAALAHGHHHAEEHDWGKDPTARPSSTGAPAVKKKAAKRAPKKK
jgi:hypothetical protein